MSITYNDFITLIGSSSLVPGTFYLIDDYQTILVVDGTASTLNDNATIEPLAVLALTTDTVNNRAYSYDNPNDIIFWDWTNNVCEDGTTARPGKITYRENKISGISTPWDFRIVQCLRGGSLILSINPNATKNIKIGLCTLSGRNYNDLYVEQRVENLIMGVGCYTTDIKARSINNVFGVGCVSNIVGETCINNTFGNYSNSNTLADDCVNNTFGNYTNSNILASLCEKNHFGDYAQANELAGSCVNNIFGDNCQNNFLDNASINNTFGISCTSNILNSSCRNNKLGNNCVSNSFASNCYGHTLGDNCQSNEFYECSYVTLGPDCTGNILETGCQNIYLCALCSSNTISTTIINVSILFPVSGQIATTSNLIYNMFDGVDAWANSIDTFGVVTTVML